MTCHLWRGDLAMRALGRADPERDPGLDAHLDQCAACRAELAELRAVSAALRSASGSAGDVAAPQALPERIVAAVGQAGRARRRRRVAVVAAAVVVAAGSAVAVGDAVTDRDRHDTTIELAGTGGTQATATLVGRDWGTEVALSVEGLADGEVYWLWLTGDDGVRVAAGTWVGTHDTTDVVMAAALPADATRRIWVTDEDDRVVLDAAVGS